MTPSRSRTMSFMMGSSGGELGQIGNTVHGLMQRSQQTEAVVAQGRIFGIDHDAVEEGVYRVFQRRQGLQRGSVIAALEGGIGLRLDGRQRIIKRSFGS